MLLLEGFKALQILTVDRPKILVAVCEVDIAEEETRSARLELELSRDIAHVPHVGS